MTGILDGWLRPRRGRRRERGMRHAPAGRAGDTAAAGGSGGSGGGMRSRRNGGGGGGRRPAAVCDACGAPGASMCGDQIGLAVMFLCESCRGDMVG